VGDFCKGVEIRLLALETMMPLQDDNNLVEQPSEESPANNQAQPSVLRELGSLGIKITIIVGIAALLFTFVFGLHYNVDSGMEPAIKDGDLVMYFRWDKNYQAGDLLLLKYQDKTQVRRVIAIEDDTVDVTKEGLVINGALQQEGAIYSKTQRFVGGADFPITLGKGEVFVLGDAREAVTDSRIYGAVSKKDTSGTVISLLRRRGL